MAQLILHNVIDCASQKKKKKKKKKKKWQYHAKNIELIKFLVFWSHWSHLIWMGCPWRSNAFYINYFVCC